MSNMQKIYIGKSIVSVVWLLVIASVIAPSQVPFSGVFLGIGGFLVIAHIYEIVVYRSLMRGVGDYLGTFFFGLLQLRTIKVQKYT